MAFIRTRVARLEAAASPVPHGTAAPQRAYRSHSAAPHSLEAAAVPHDPRQRRTGYGITVVARL